jgi:hypothetical protein
VFQAAIIIRGSVVVITADQATGDVRADHDHLGLDVLGALRGDRHAVPARLQSVVAERRVDVPGAVAARVERPAVDDHRDGDPHGGSGDERPPAPVAQERRAHAPVGGVRLVAVAALVASPAEQDPSEDPDEGR